MTKAKKKVTPKITTKAKASLITKKAPSSAKKPVVRKAPTTVPKTKTAPAKPTEIEKLKLQIKNLRASLKETKTENELQQKQIASLTRKNANLTRKLDAPSTATKPKARTSNSDNEKWVDKWWETF